MIQLFLLLGTLVSAQEVATPAQEIRTVPLTAVEASSLRDLLLKQKRELDKKEDSDRSLDRLAIVSESPSDVRVRFEGDLRFGARTIFGPRDGARITEALTRLRGELRLDTADERVGRVTFDGLFGASQTADRIVPDQAAAEHMDATAAVTGFYMDDSLKSPNRFSSVGWEVQFRRIQADPIGIRDENGVNVLPFVIEQGSKEGKIRVGLGVRYEDTHFDRDFLQSINSNSENEESNIGIYCEVRGDVRATDTSGFRFEPYFTGFFRNASAVETLRLGADLSINPIPSALRQGGGWTERCMLGATFEYVNFGNDPTDSARYLGLFMGVKF